MGAAALELLQLSEGQDMAVVTRQEWLAQSIWSTQLGTDRPWPMNCLK